MKSKEKSTKTMSGIDLLLLGLLTEKPLNAYELANFIENNHLNNILKISKPAVYKNCKSLYRSGFLDGKASRDGESPEKVTYRVNAAGKKYFYQLMEHYSRELKPFYFEHNSFIWNLEKLEKNEGMKMLNSLQMSLSAVKSWIVPHEQEVLKSGAFGAKALVKQYRMILETMIQWLDELIVDYQKK